MDERYTLPGVVWGDWEGLRAAAWAAGYGLAWVMPPRAPEHYRATPRDGGGPARVFATRGEVCDWLDAGAAETLPLWQRRAA